MSEAPTKKHIGLRVRIHSFVCRLGDGTERLSANEGVVAGIERFRGQACVRLRREPWPLRIDLIVLHDRIRSMEVLPS